LPGRSPAMTMGDRGSDEQHHAGGWRAMNKVAGRR